MQDTAHAAGTPTAHQGGPLSNPLEQAPPCSRTRATSGGAPPRSRGNTSLERAPPRSRARSTSGGFRPARGYVPPSAGVRHARGRPSRVRRPPVHGHLMPDAGGMAPSCARGSRPGVAAPTPHGGAHPHHCGEGLCSAAGVSPVTPRAYSSTANAPDPRGGPGAPSIHFLVTLQG
jgi:hypothetical protein